MHERMIPIPVTCRTCGKVCPTEFPESVITVALTKWNRMALYSGCHPEPWDASPDEIERIRDHVRLVRR